MAKRTIIITGASRGIGLAIAKHLISGDHNVVVLARSKAPLEELQIKHPDQVRFLAGDMADFSFATRASDLAMQEFGQIDGLIVNHGLLPPVTSVDDSDAEAWRKSFDINFFSAVALVSNSAYSMGSVALILFPRLKPRFRHFENLKAVYS